MTQQQTSLELENIQRRMQNVRSLIDEDVEDLVESTKEIFDWKNYAKHYPIATAVTAVVGGYFAGSMARSVIRIGSSSLSLLTPSTTSKTTSEDEQENSGAENRSAGIAGAIAGYASAFISKSVKSYLSTIGSSVVRSMTETYRQKQNDEQNEPSNSGA